MEMQEKNSAREVEQCASQGDLRVLRLDALPHDAIKQEPQKGKLIAGHSETGHHHYIDSNKYSAEWFEDKANPFVCYLRVNDEHALLEHARPVNPHGTIKLRKGVWKVKRQREWSPAGERRVQD